MARVHTGNRGRLPRSCKSTSTATQLAQKDPHESLKREPAAAAPVAATSWLRLSRSHSTPATCGKYKREQEQEARQDFLEADQAWRVEHKAHKQQCAACGMWRVWQVASGKQRWPVAVAPLPPLTGKVCNENFLVKTKLKCEKMFNRIENKAEREVREGQRRGERAACSINNNLIIKWIMCTTLCKCVLVG